MVLLSAVLSSSGNVNLSNSNCSSVSINMAFAKHESVEEACKVTSDYPFLPFVRPYKMNPDATFRQKSSTTHSSH